MDFKSFKDVNKVKAALKEIYDSFLAEIKKAKDIEAASLKKQVQENLRVKICE